MSEVKKVLFDEIPNNCGDCPLMVYEHDTTPRCAALPYEWNEIAGNPYEMKYRRSDCLGTSEGGDT